MVDIVPATAEWSHDDRIFVALYVESGNASNAAMQAYRLADPVTASRRGNAFLKANSVVLNMVLERQGLTDAALAKPIADALTATKVTHAKYQGEIDTEQSVSDIDHGTRLHAAKLGMQLKGHLNKRDTSDDDEARALGPVILPVPEGLELPSTAEILDTMTKGGDTQGVDGEVSEVGGDNARSDSPGGDNSGEENIEKTDDGEW